MPIKIPAIIGNDIKDAFFEYQDPIGKYIKIDGIKFRVIGVLEKQGKFLGLFSVDNQAILPLGAYTRLFSKRGFMRISIKVDEKKNIMCVKGATPGARGTWLILEDSIKRNDLKEIEPKSAQASQKDKKE